MFPKNHRQDYTLLFSHITPHVYIQQIYILKQKVKSCMRYLQT